MSTIPVSLDHQQIGSITLESPNHLEAHRTAGGFRLHLPITVRLGMEKGATTRPLLTNLRANLLYEQKSGVLHHLGQAQCNFVFTASAPEGAGYGELIWWDSLAALAHYERLRAGTPARIKVKTNRWLRTEPFFIGGDAEVQYHQHVWLGMLRQIGAADNVLVEVPLPGIAPDGWNVVWQELVEARNAFEQGRETGWSQCVVKVRTALEAWKKIEPEKQPLPAGAKEDWTKKDRLDGLRWQLHECCHPAAHMRSGPWSRDEALLMLSTLSALLAARNP